MKKFNIADYEGTYVMHCDTKEKAKVFCNFLNSLGLEWIDGKKYSEATCWSTFWYGDQTVYYFNEGLYGDIKQVSNQFTVLEFDDFEWDIIPKLESGMVVETKEDKYLVVGDRLVSETGWNPLASYDDSLTNKRGRNIYDIQKIYKHTRGLSSIYAALDDNNLTLIWERKDNKGNLFHGQTLEYWHRVMWNWLADNPDKNKEDWGELQNFTKEEMDELKHNCYCFACIAVNRTGSLGCNKCPVSDYDNKRTAGCMDGLFNKWDNSEGYERMKVAHEIANLEWKEK